MRAPIKPPISRAQIIIPMAMARSSLVILLFFGVAVALVLGSRSLVTPVATSGYDTSAIYSRTPRLVSKTFFMTTYRLCTTKVWHPYFIHNAIP
jgi:hypothetical protein